MLSNGGLLSHLLHQSPCTNWGSMNPGNCIFSLRHDMLLYEQTQKHVPVITGYSVPLVLWHCWLGIRKSIRPVKTEWWGVCVVICLERDADCLHMVQLMPLPSHNPVIFASFKSRLVLPFWYRLTQVVLEKRPLNGCSSSSSNVHINVHKTKSWIIERKILSDM